MNTKDDQARQRLVEIALEQAAWVDNDHAAHICKIDCTCMRAQFRRRAGFRDPARGHWCAAGLTAAMDDAGLLVPEPGTSARRGALALLDFVHKTGQPVVRPWKLRVTADSPYLLEAQPGDIIAWLQHPPPDPAGWRRGHVAVIVGVDDESITTVGWNEGKAPGRVMMRKLWRDPEHEIDQPDNPDLRHVGYTRAPMPAETVLLRRPGGLYGIARPVAR